MHEWITNNSDFIAAGILIIVMGFLVQQTLPDWRRPLGPWCRNRNLYFIAIIWIGVIGNSYYDYLVMEVHYEQFMSDSEFLKIAGYGKKSAIFGGLLWGTFFTGYFLNNHLNLRVEDE